MLSWHSNQEGVHCNITSNFSLTSAVNRSLLSPQASDLIDILYVMIDATEKLLTSCEKIASGSTSPVNAIHLSSSVFTIGICAQSLRENCDKLPQNPSMQAIAIIEKVLDTPTHSGKREME